MENMHFDLYWVQKCHNKITVEYSIRGSGGSRNLERGFDQPGARSALEKFFGCHSHFHYVNAFITHVIIVTTDW